MAGPEISHKAFTKNESGPARAPDELYASREDKTLPQRETLEVAGQKARQIIAHQSGADGEGGSWVG